MQFTITADEKTKYIDINKHKEFIVLNWLRSWDFMLRDRWRITLHKIRLECKSLWLLKSIKLIDDTLLENNLLLNKDE